MTIAEMFAQGLTLTCLGMGIVFGFLVLLVLATQLMCRVTQRQSCEARKREVPATPAAGPPSPDIDLVAVISAAIHRHRLHHA